MILRPSHEHRGFRSLEIAFADGEDIRLTASHERGQWTGPDPETVARYVQAHVSPDRIAIRASRGPARSLEEARYRIDMIERDAPLRKWVCRGVVSVALFVTGVEIYTRAMKEGWNPLQWDGVTQLACVVSIVAANMLGFLIWVTSRYVGGVMEQERQALIKALDELEHRGSAA